MSKAKQPSPSASQGIVAATRKALKESIDSKLCQAALTKSNAGEFQIDANLKGLAADTMKKELVNETLRRLCNNGFVSSLTCESTAPGKATYYFDFTTERGRERVEVGFSMDTDRAAFVGKKVLSFIQGK
jgi:hypothetical protein